MLIYWFELSGHLLRLNDDTEWCLYSEMDKYNIPNLYLKVGEQTHIVANGDFYLQGRENMPLDQSDLLEYYTAVVQQVGELISTENPHAINIEAIKDHLLRTYWWPKWRAAGRVTDDFWSAEPVGACAIVS